MRSCDEVLERIADVQPWVGGGGPFSVAPWARPEALALQQHLALCAACAEAAEDLAQTLLALRTRAPEVPELAPDLDQRVLAALANEPLPAATRSSPASGPRPRALGAGWLRAAAALLCFGAGALAATVADGFDAPTARLAPAPQPPPEVRPSSPRTPDAPAPALPEPPQQAAVSPPGGAAPAEVELSPLARYVAEAGLVLQALDELEPGAAQDLVALASQVRELALVEDGERLLLEVDAAADQRGRALRPILSGTQLILRKVGNVRHPEDARTAVITLRREVQQTGILDACRAVLSSATAEPRPRRADPALAARGSDPL